MDKNLGYIKLYRKFLGWEWYDHLAVKVLFIHCLLKANHTDKKYRGQVVKRGTFLTGLKKLADETKLTVQQTRTSIGKLKSTGEISTFATNKGTVLTVCNYDSYQAFDTTKQQTNNKPTTNQQQTNNKRTTTTNKVKNVKNVKKKPLRTKKPATLHVNLRTYFENFFTDHKENPYYWTAKDGAALKKLITKIKFSYSAKGFTAPNETQIEAAFAEILRRANADKFLADKLELSIINSQYNKIINNESTTESAIEQIKREIIDGSD